MFQSLPAGRKLTITVYRAPRGSVSSVPRWKVVLENATTVPAGPLAATSCS